MMDPRTQVVSKGPVALTVGAKMRYPTWWWGNYVKFTGKQWVDQNGFPFPSIQVDLAQMQEYDEVQHGKDAEPVNSHVEHISPTPGYRDVVVDTVVDTIEMNQIFNT